MHTETVTFDRRHLLRMASLGRALGRRQRASRRRSPSIRAVDVRAAVVSHLGRQPTRARSKRPDTGFRNAAVHDYQAPLGDSSQATQPTGRF